MDPRERLRMALLGAGCTRCGNQYPAEGIRVLAQRDEVAFVELACPVCSTETLALVTGMPMAADADGGASIDRSELTSSVRPSASSPRRSVPDRTPADRTPADRSRAPAAAVTESDVEDMRSFLRGYDGDLRRLLERGGEAGRR